MRVFDYLEYLFIAVFAERRKQKNDDTSGLVPDGEHILAIRVVEFAASDNFVIVSSKPKKLKCWPIQVGHRLTV